MQEGNIIPIQEPLSVACLPAGQGPFPRMAERASGVELIIPDLEGAFVLVLPLEESIGDWVGQVPLVDGYGALDAKSKPPPPRPPSVPKRPPPTRPSGGEGRGPQKKPGRG